MISIAPGTLKEMDAIKQLQTAINEAGYAPALVVDGDVGPKTTAAVAGMISDYRTVGWSARRKLIGAEQAAYAKLGIDPGPVDGFLGPLTLYARKTYGAKLEGTTLPLFRDDEKKPSVPMPDTADKWPRDSRDSAALIKFYGKPGENHARLDVPKNYPMILYDGPRPVSHLVVHEKIVEPVKRVLMRVLDHYGPEEIARLGFNKYFGCYNPRKKRGGSTWSIHAFAAALDFNANQNQLEWDHTRASFAHKDCDQWWEFWEAEGFVSLGRVRDYDWMHVQAARL